MAFPNAVRCNARNVSEAQTLEQMVKHLSATAPAARPTVVMDAGIASEENVAWLKAQDYPYLVVSRERHKQFDPEQATVIRDQPGVRISVQRVLDETTGEVRLYCHSSAREDKERGIAERFCTGLEKELKALAEGLHQPRRVKDYDKVLVRIGRLRQRYARVARYYDIRLEKDQTTGRATALHWQRLVPTEDILPGVYCLRTNRTRWDESTLWQTYTMLTDLETCQACCLLKGVLRDRRETRVSRCAPAEPSAAARCVAHAGAAVPWHRRGSATVDGQHAPPCVPAPSCGRSN